MTADEKRKLHAAFKLTSALCALPVRPLMDGHEYIRRDSVMDLIATWRREIDAIEDRLTPCA